VGWTSVEVVDKDLEALGEAVVGKDLVALSEVAVVEVEIENQAVDPVGSRGGGRRGTSGGPDEAPAVDFTKMKNSSNGRD
jgi:hypothetical protein